MKGTLTPEGIIRSTAEVSGKVRYRFIYVHKRVTVPAIRPDHQSLSCLAVHAYLHLVPDVKSQISDLRTDVALSTASKGKTHM